MKRTLRAYSWGRIGALTLVLAGWMPMSMAATPQPNTAATPAASRSIDQWLQRLHDASRHNAYVGTFVMSAGPDISASRIWHVCEGTQQFERIEALTGAPRTTLRRDDEVVTVLLDARVALWEKRDGMRLFPELQKEPGRQIGVFYAANWVGQDRVAGLDADVVDVVPRDAWRFGYRLWLERKSGLVLKSQTRNVNGHVLEQVAFTELQFSPTLSADKVVPQMSAPAGYQLVKPVLRHTSLDKEGWRLRAMPPGFQMISCQGREAALRQPPMVQCVFADGLASVSLFIEPYDGNRHPQERSAASGATRFLSRRMGDQWVTVMGEVPGDTLLQFVRELEPAR